MAYTKSSFEDLINQKLPNLSEESKKKLTSKEAIKFLNRKKENFLTYAIAKGDIDLIREIISIDKQHDNKLFDERDVFEAAIKVGNMDVVEEVVRLGLETQDLKRKENLIYNIGRILLDESIVFADKNKAEAAKRIRKLYYPNTDQKVFSQLRKKEYYWKVGDEVRGLFSYAYLNDERKYVEVETRIYKELIKSIDESPIGEILLAQAIYVLKGRKELLKSFLDEIASNKSHKISTEQLEGIVYNILVSNQEQSFVFLEVLFQHDLGKRLLAERGMIILHWVVDNVGRGLNKNRVTYLLEKVDFGPSRVDKYGWNILHYAAYQIDQDLFFKILDGQQDASLANTLSKSGENFLDIAIRVKNNVVLKRLLTDEKYRYFREKLFSPEMNVLRKCIDSGNGEFFEMLLDTVEGRNLIAADARALDYASGLSVDVYEKSIANANFNLIDMQKVLKAIDDKAYGSYRYDHREYYGQIRKAIAKKFLKDDGGVDFLINLWKEGDMKVQKSICVFELMMMNSEQLNYFLRDQDFAKSVISKGSDSLLVKILSTENGEKLLSDAEIMKVIFDEGSEPSTYVKLLDHKEVRDYIKDKPHLIERIIENQSSSGWIKLLDHDEIKTHLRKSNRVALFTKRWPALMNHHELVNKLILNGFENQIRKQREEEQERFLRVEGSFGGKEITYFERMLKEKENLRKVLKRELLNILRGTETEFEKSTLFELIRVSDIDEKKIPDIDDLDLDSSFFQRFRSASSKVTNEMVNELVDDLLSKDAAYKKVFSNVDAKDKKYNRFMNKKEHGSGKLNAVRERFSNAAKLMLGKAGDKNDMNVLLEAWNSACRDYQLPAFTMHLDEKSVMKFDKTKEDILKSITENKEIDKSVRKSLLKNLDEIENQLAAVNPTNIERSQIFSAKELNNTSTEYTVAEIMLLAFMGVLTVICIALLAVLIVAVGVLALAASGGGSDFGSREGEKSLWDFLGLRFQYIGSKEENIPVHENFYRLSKAVEQTGKALNDIEKLIGEKSLEDPKLEEDLNKAKSFISKVKDGIKGVVEQYEQREGKPALVR